MVRSNIFSGAPCDFGTKVIGPPGFNVERSSVNGFCAFGEVCGTFNSSVVVNVSGIGYPGKVMFFRVVVLLNTFRGMGPRRNFTETQQLSHTQSSGLLAKDRKREEPKIVEDQKQDSEGEILSLHRGVAVPCLNVGWIKISDGLDKSCPLAKVFGLFFFWGGSRKRL